MQVQRTGAFTFMKEDMPKTKSILHVVVAREAVIRAKAWVINHWVKKHSAGAVIRIKASDCVLLQNILLCKMTHEVICFTNINVKTEDDVQGNGSREMLSQQKEHCHGLQGKGCSSHCGQLERPVAGGHHNLGRVGLSPSSASKKAESSFLDPGLSIYDTTTGSLLWTTATSPFFQRQGTPSTPYSARIHCLQCRFSTFVAHIRQLPCLQTHTATGERYKTEPVGHLPLGKGVTATEKTRSCKQTFPTLAANYFLFPKLASGRKGCCILMLVSPDFHLHVPSVKL
ncbi:hypothetical protein EK904_003930 [Melospiza melodia maxima]|nr:hypothetical protein EK904_003930 [Melospiza melodia maxima]